MLPKCLVKHDLSDAEASKEWDGRSKFAAPGPAYREVRRLSEQELDRLIAGYRGGRTVYELGREFGIHRVTVSNILKRHDVPMRFQGLSETQRTEIARLRDQGWTYDRLGRRFGVDGCTVRRFLARG